MNRCATCVYWEPKRGVAEGSATQPGFCHQRPPVPVMAINPHGSIDGEAKVVLRTVWPIVEATSWCGRHRKHWRAREDAAAPAGNETQEPALPPAGSEAAPDTVGGAASRLSEEAVA